ncbi:hypothetical protein N665_0119s0074 [Sinapis alba]|nr:hypothetical protein N665_0119s0074 [Sinapis alba]
MQEAATLLDNLHRLRGPDLTQICRHTTRKATRTGPFIFNPQPRPHLLSRGVHGHRELDFRSDGDSEGNTEKIVYRWLRE